MTVISWTIYQVRPSINNCLKQKMVFAPFEIRTQYLALIRLTHNHWDNMNIVQNLAPFNIQSNLAPKAAASPALCQGRHCVHPPLIIMVFRYYVHVRLRLVFFIAVLPGPKCDPDEPQASLIAVNLLLRHGSRRPSLSSSMSCSVTHPPRTVTVCCGGCDGRNPLWCPTVKLGQQWNFSSFSHLVL